MDKCTECPECGCSEYNHKDGLGDGFRVCSDCQQEWWIDINYRKYSSPIHYEVFSHGGARSLPTKDSNGDANQFDKRSVKRRIRKLIKYGGIATAFVTRPGHKRTMIFKRIFRRKNFA